MSLKCVNHPESVTEVLCGKCEKGFCKLCRISKNNRYLCIECLREVEKEPTRDKILENRVVSIGAIGFIIGVVFLLWGILAFLHWNPPVRYNILKDYEVSFFCVFGFISIMSSVMLISFWQVGRFLQIFLSLLGIGAMATWHPVAIVGALAQIYILAVLLFPKTADVFSPEYQHMVPKEERQAGALGFLESVKFRVLILAVFIGGFLNIVIFIVLAALQPVSYAPTGVQLIGTEGSAIFMETIQNNQFYKIAFRYDFQKVYPRKLEYQIFLDNEVFQKGIIMPPPGSGKSSFESPRSWKSYPGLHKIRVVLFVEENSPEYRAYIYKFNFQVPSQ